MASLSATTLSSRLTCEKEAFLKVDARILQSSIMCPKMAKQCVLEVMWLYMILESPSKTNSWRPISIATKEMAFRQANFSSSSIEDGRFIHSESVAMTQPSESQTTTPNLAEFVS